MSKVEGYFAVRPIDQNTSAKHSPISSASSLRNSTLCLPSRKTCSQSAVDGRVWEVAFCQWKIQIDEKWNWVTVQTQTFSAECSRAIFQDVFFTKRIRVLLFHFYCASFTASSTASCVFLLHERKTSSDHPEEQFSIIYLYSLTSRTYFERRFLHFTRTHSCIRGSCSVFECLIYAREFLISAEWFIFSKHRDILLQ